MKVLVTILALGVLAAPAAPAAPAAHAEIVEITATGVVGSNFIGDPPLNGVGVGEAVNLSFTVDSDVFTDGVPGDTRGYEIDPSSFLLSFDTVMVGLLNPFPAGETPYFTLVEGFPVTDGFFVSTSPNSPGGVPLEQEPINLNLDLGYEGFVLDSLDILDAIGTYGFDGLTRFGFTLWAIFPDNVAMEMEFEQMTIAEFDPTPTEDSRWSGVKATFD